MQDLVSRLAFGFVMAQFVPGLVLLLSGSFLYLAVGESAEPTIPEHLSRTVSVWMASSPLQITFLLLSVAGGMAIHGLHWAVLGFLEFAYGEHRDGKFERSPVSYSFWHNLPIGLQILSAPVKLTAEVLWFLACARNPRDIAIEENVPRIKKESFEALKFLEDFYLHFAQFYAHTSYALVVTFWALLAYSIFQGISWGRVLILCSSYLLIGFFFVISRIQLAGLFKAENELTGA